MQWGTLSCTGDCLQMATSGPLNLFIWYKLLGQNSAAFGQYEIRYTRQLVKHKA